MNQRLVKPWLGNIPDRGHCDRSQVKKMGDAVEPRRSGSASCRARENLTG
ncbi:MAG: hypothetical protein H5U05_06920 [Candidatus Aminicenantes bacterium]|nr:hypothetical protein [Candidatus Aminicenantes bacterium]